MLTGAAEEDLRAGVIRPTYGAQPGSETPTSERAFLRALLMRATLETLEVPEAKDADSAAMSLMNAARSAVQAGGAKVALEDFALEEVEREIAAREYEGESLRLEAFSIALTLNKAMSRGAEVAQELVDIFVENGVVDEKYAGKPLLLARKTREVCPEFEYRPLEGCPDFDPEYEGREEEFSDLPEYPEEGARRGLGAEGLAGAAEVEEIAVGEYSAGEYDWVNRVKWTPF